MRRYLIVANETATSAPLLERVRECLSRGPSTFHLLVPARHPHGSWSEGQATAAARARVDEAITALREIGAEVDGEVGDANPVVAVTDVLLSRAFDEIIISTLPAGASRWLRQDVPTRLARRVALPISHVVDAPARVR